MYSKKLTRIEQIFIFFLSYFSGLNTAIFLEGLLCRLSLTHRVQKMRILMKYSTVS